MTKTYIINYFGSSLIKSRLKAKDQLKLLQLNQPVFPSVQVAQLATNTTPSWSRTFTSVYNIKEKNYLPFFKNPNTPINLNLLASVAAGKVSSKSATCGSLTISQKLASGNEIPPFILNPKYKYQAPATGQTNLVFIQSKGSQKPNPNIISYNFSSSFNQNDSALGRAGQLQPAYFQDCNITSNYGPKSLVAGQQLNKLKELEAISEADGPQANESQASLEAAGLKSLAAKNEKSIYNINNIMIENIYNILYESFKSMYCLISKPLIINSNDKIKIQLFYFVCVSSSLSWNSNLLSKNLKSAAPVKAKAAAAAGAEGLAGQQTELALPAKANVGEPAAAQKAINFKPASRAGARRANLALKNFNSKDLNVKIKLIKLAQSEYNLTKIFYKKFKLICAILSKFFKKSVEIELIRLHQPYFDSNILVNYLSLFINKKNIGAAIKKLYNRRNIINSSQIPNTNKKGLGYAYLLKTKGLQHQLSQLVLPAACAELEPKPKIAAYLSGLNIKISGRLMREPIIPRRTTKKFDKGFTAKGKINFSDIGRFTHKNRKGAFTITVKSGQKFY